MNSQPQLLPHPQPTSSARRWLGFAQSPLARQLAAFFGVGLTAVAVHYSVLVACVQALGWRPVGAALTGYTAGGVVSYTLNRRHTYASDRPHAEATWRFAVVALVGFVLTWLLMTLLVVRAGIAYLPAQVTTTGLVMIWSFLGNKFWTFTHAA